MVITKFLLIFLVPPLVSVLSSGCLSEQDLLMGQYYCADVEVDVNTQSAVGCTDGFVNVTCFVAPNLTLCSSAAEGNFTKQLPCRDVKGRRYNYFVAVSLSLFFGMFGLDRFYLGYPAIGLVKLCTFGFFLVGQLVDFLLILLQYVGPADRSDYYVPFYGPIVTRINTTGQYLGQTCV